MVHAGMDLSALYPPNCSSMKDDVIAHVLPRAAPPPSNLFVGESLRNADSKLMPRQNLLTETKRVVTVPFIAEPRGTPPRVVAMREQSLETVQMQTKSALELRRERNRIHQARHKMRQTKKMQDLEESVKKLRRQIQQLEVQCQIKVARMLESKTVWKVAAEYFRLFRFGVRTPTTAMETSSTLVRRGSTDVAVQRNFLLSSMALDVVYGAVCGIDALLEDWRLMTLYHEDIDVQLVRLENSACGAVVATSRGKLTISEHTLRYAFPNLLKEGEEGQIVPLAQKLLGQKLVVTGTSCFYWDDAKGCVVCFAPKVDMITPLLKLLGSLEDVARVFDNALLTPEYELVENRGRQALSSRNQYSNHCIEK